MDQINTLFVFELISILYKAEEKEDEIFQLKNIFFLLSSLE